MNFSTGKKRLFLGFTLIELLVVISIIGMLASTVLAATNRARAKARGGAFKKEMQQLVLATQMYYFNNGSSWGGDVQFVTSSCPNTGTNSLNTMFADTEIRKILDGFTKLYPNGTIECLAANDGLTTGPAKYWTIYFTAPGSGGVTNKWCIDNYLSTSASKQLIGTFNGPANRGIIVSGGGTPILVYCGEPGGGSNIGVGVTTNQDW